MKKCFVFMTLFEMFYLGCGQFESLDDPKESSTALQGSALMPDGSKAAGFDVYLVTDPGSQKVTKTDAQGKFKLDSAPTGAMKLVLNNHKGMGLLREVVLYAHGENVFNDLTMADLTQWPELVDIAGIGYEERISTIDEDYLFPIFTKDGSRAYAARKLPGEAYFDIVEIVTSTGTERVLFEDVSINQSGVPLRLIDDRFLVFEVCYFGECFPGYSVNNLLFVYDIQTNTDKTLQLPSVYQSWFRNVTNPMWTHGESLIIITSTDEIRYANEGKTEVHTSNIFSLFDPVYNYLMSPLLDGKHFNRVTTLLYDSQNLVLSAYRGCFETTEQWMNCSEEEMMQEQKGRTEIYSLNLDDHTTDSIVIPDLLTDSFVAVRQSVVALEDDHKSLVVLRRDPYFQSVANTIGLIDIKTGTTRNLFISNEQSQIYFEKIWNLDKKNHVALMTQQLEESSLWSGITILNISTADLISLPNQVEIDGNLFTICQSNCVESPNSITVCYPTNCEVEWHSDSSTIQVRDTLISKNELSWAIIADLSLDGVVLRKRMVHVGRNEPFPALLESPNQKFEAMVGRNPETGFNQIFSGKTTDDTNLEQLTFLPSEHQAAVFSEDGRWLYTFTKDPISGYQQLFRIEIDEKPIE